MRHIFKNLKHLSIIILKKKFLIFFMYFYGLNLGSPGAGQSWTQRPFYVFLWLEPGTPWRGPSWTLGPLFEQIR